jgi:hypothetical protein
LFAGIRSCKIVNRLDRLDNTYSAHIFPNVKSTNHYWKQPVLVFNFFFSWRRDKNPLWTFLFDTDQALFALKDTSASSKGFIFAPYAVLGMV